MNSVKLEEPKCPKNIGGCQIKMKKIYSDFHEENLCPYRPIEKNIMNGIFHDWQIKNQIKPLQFLRNHIFWSEIGMEKSRLRENI